MKVYDEVWVFFDKDGHPKAKEAFEMARITEIDGKKINIAFLHIPVDTRSAFPVISVQSPVSIQYRWQS